METNKGTRANAGKGGNFVSKPNPFGTRVASIAPALADNSATGLAIDAVLRSGNAIMFSRTRDGGAISITILEGDTRHRTYCANDGQLDDALSAMRETFTE